MSASRRASPLGFAAVAALVLGACGGASGLREGAPPTDPVSEVSAERLFETGMSSAAQGDLVRAEQYLAAAGARGYDETKVIGPLVRVCVAASRLRQALVYAQPYLRTHADDWRLRFVVATVHLGLDRVDEARVELERVIVAAPDVPEPHFVLGMLLRDRLSDEATAKPHLERYLALAPTGAHADEARSALSTPLPPEPVQTPMPPVQTPMPPVQTPMPPVQTPMPPVQTPMQPVQTPVQPVHTPVQPVHAPMQPPTATGTP